MSFGALPYLRCLRAIEYHQDVQANIACRKAQTSATYQPCKDKHLGFRGYQAVPHAFAGHTWQLIADVLARRAKSKVGLRQKEPGQRESENEDAYDALKDEELRSATVKQTRQENTHHLQMTYVKASSLP
ncbi:MAG: hypothetical protein LQ345_006352, partial [Seirophora villosa]